MVRKIKTRPLKLSLIGVAIALAAALILLSLHKQTPSKVSSNSSNRTIDVSFNKRQYSINDPASLWVVVNKGRALPSTYVPEGLASPNIPIRPNAISDERLVGGQMKMPLESLAAAANQAGYQLMLASGYRSYATQQAVYGNFVTQMGMSEADKSSARPGHSEHQTGLAADLEPTSRKCEIQQCFGDTPEGQWLAANSYKYGFIIRYAQGNEPLTGYEYEPWHVRYLGASLAQQIHQSGETLEQFFALPAYTSYPPNSFRLTAGS